jgi:hypothetical protein
MQLDLFQINKPCLIFWHPRFHYELLNQLLGLQQYGRQIYSKGWFALYYARLLLLFSYGVQGAEVLERTRRLLSSSALSASKNREWKGKRNTRKPWQGLDNQFQPGYPAAAKCNVSAGQLDSLRRRHSRSSLPWPVQNGSVYMKHGGEYQGRRGETGIMSDGQLVAPIWLVGRRYQRPTRSVSNFFSKQFWTPFFTFEPRYRILPGIPRFFFVVSSWRIWRFNWTGGIQIQPVPLIGLRTSLCATKLA